MTPISANGWFAASCLIKNSYITSHALTAGAKPEHIHTGEETLRLFIGSYEFLAHKIDKRIDNLGGNKQKQTNKQKHSNNYRDCCVCSPRGS